MGNLGTDHCLVVRDVRACFPARRYVAPRPRYNVQLVEDADVCSQYQGEVGALVSEFGTPNEQWQTLRDGILQAGNNHLLVTRHTGREHPWLMGEALQAIEEKGRALIAYKGQNVSGRLRLKRAIIPSKTLHADWFGGMNGRIGRHMQQR